MIVDMLYAIWESYDFSALSDTDIAVNIRALLKIKSDLSSFCGCGLSQQFSWKHPFVYAEW